VPTHVALLRGINLGARNRVAMADLRRVVTSLGHTDVATYIKSGNAVFTAQERDSLALAGALERPSPKTWTSSRAWVLSRAELAQVVADNPFPPRVQPEAPPCGAQG